MLGKKEQFLRCIKNRDRKESLKDWKVNWSQRESERERKIQTDDETLYLLLLPKQN